MERTCLISEQSQRYRALYRAVLMQIPVDLKSRSRKNAKCGRDAWLWVKQDGEDFWAVCDIAEYPPDRVRLKAAQLIQWRQDSVLVRFSKEGQYDLFPDTAPPFPVKKRRIPRGRRSPSVSFGQLTFCFMEPE